MSKKCRYKTSPKRAEAYPKQGHSVIGESHDIKDDFFTSSATSTKKIHVGRFLKESRFHTFFKSTSSYQSLKKRMKKMTHEKGKK